MTRKKIIKKWEAEILLLKKVINENALLSTPMEKTKAAGKIMAISAMLSDIKSMELECDCK